MSNGTGTEATLASLAASLTEIKQAVADAQKERHQIETKVAAGLAKVDGQLSTMQATLKATADRSRDEIGELFRRTNEDAQRIGVIERDYVPEKDFVHHKEKNREEHKDMRDLLDGLRTQMTRIVATGAVIWAIVSVGAQLLLRMLWQ